MNIYTKISKIAQKYKDTILNTQLIQFICKKLDLVISYS